MINDNIQQIIRYVIENKELIIFSIFSLSVLVQLYYYLVVYTKVAFYKGQDLSIAKSQPVSVIICARNEAENLDKFLPAVLTQDYPNYEVIVVNDCSTDHTDEIIGKYLKEYNHLKTTTINEDIKFSHGKKLAITVGIKSAQHECLLFIDADCKPVSPNWITLMQSHFTENTEIVLGYGGYFRKKGMLNKYIRYDTMTIAMQYLSYAAKNKPYMGVGRNLAYKKSLFFRNKGFASHLKLNSGDDDLFVNEAATKCNTAIEFSHDSHTRSEPEIKFAAWAKQKKRHLTTSKYYEKKHKRILGIEILSRLITYALVPVLLIYPQLTYITGGIFIFREISFLVVIKSTMNKLNEKGFLINTLLYDIFSIIINFILHIINFFQIRYK